MALLLSTTAAFTLKAGCNAPGSVSQGHLDTTTWPSNVIFSLSLGPQRALSESETLRQRYSTYVFERLTRCLWNWTISFYLSGHYILRCSIIVFRNARFRALSSSTSSSARQRQNVGSLTAASVIGIGKKS